jgi:hypothetical protein
MGTLNIYIGTNDKDSKQRELSLETIKDIIKNKISMHFDSFSLELITGVYKNMEELTYKVSIMEDKVDKTANADIITDIIDTLKFALNQECIMIECVPNTIIAFR